MTATGDWWDQEHVEKAVADAMLEGGKLFMEAVLTKAIDAAPVETGTLRRSGTVTVGGLPVAVLGREIRSGQSSFVGAMMNGRDVGAAQEVYTSFNTPYCIVMHEHNYKAKLAGGPKYLQAPFDAMKSLAQKYVEQHVKKVLARG